MEDAIEICTGCGKMPRAIDNLTGSFVCSRCGGHTTTTVNSNDYERVVTELDKTFHENILKKKAESIPREPVKAKTATKKVRKPASARPSARKKAKPPVKKPAVNKGKRRKA